MPKIDAQKYALPNQMQLAKQVRNNFALSVPSTIAIEDVMEPTYLSACLGQHEIRVGSRIEIIAADTWWAELLVIAVNKDRKTVWTKLITKPILLSYDPTAGSKNYIVAPGVKGRTVVRLGNKTVKDFATKAEAEAFIKNEQAA